MQLIQGVNCFHRKGGSAAAAYGNPGSVRLNQVFPQAAARLPSVGVLPINYDTRPQYRCTKYVRVRRYRRRRGCGHVALIVRQLALQLVVCERFDDFATSKNTGLINITDNLLYSEVSFLSLRKTS